jgi:hypothetical protein
MLLMSTRGTTHSLQALDPPALSVSAGAMHESFKYITLHDSGGGPVLWPICVFWSPEHDWEGLGSECLQK